MNKDLPNVTLSGFNKTLLTHLWEKIKHSEVAWGKQEKDLESFLANMSGLLSFVLHTEDFLLWFEGDETTRIIKAHGYFFNPSVLKNSFILKDCLRYVFKQFNPIRIEVKFPQKLKWLHRLCKKVGLVHEGDLRNYQIFNSETINISIYSMIEEDLEGV